MTGNSKKTSPNSPTNFPKTVGGLGWSQTFQGSTTVSQNSTTGSATLISKSPYSLPKERAVFAIQPGVSWIEHPVLKLNPVCVMVCGTCGAPLGWNLEAFLHGGRRSAALKPNIPESTKSSKQASNGCAQNCLHLIW